MLTFGAWVLGVSDRKRAEDFWCAAIGYQVHDGPYGNRFCIVDLDHEYG